LFFVKSGKDHCLWRPFHVFCIERKCFKYRAIEVFNEP
jgi:hypothetical protein